MMANYIASIEVDASLGASMSSDRTRTTQLVIATFWLFGCGKMAVDGEIVDASGEPLEGATVTAIGTQCQTVTDDHGRFSLACMPGTYKVSIGQAGYISDELEVEAPERKRYDVGKRTLIKIPEEEGFFIFDRNTYKPMKPGFLERKSGGKGMDQYRHYCLDKDGSEATKLTPGVYPFFDNEASGWKPFKLDDDGCAYKMSPTSGSQWGVDYAEKPKFESRQVAREKDIVLMELDEGEYFVADWGKGKGFFVPTEEDKHRYTGFWISVGR